MSDNGPCNCEQAMQLEEEIDRLKQIVGDSLKPCDDCAIERAEKAEAEIERLDRHSDELYEHYKTAVDEREKWQARAEEAEAKVSEYGTKYKNAKKRADEAEADVERLATIGTNNEEV